MLADRIKALEDNPLLIAYREFLILEARRIFDPEEQHKRTYKLFESVGSLTVLLCFQSYTDMMELFRNIRAGYGSCY
jgi:hypothetical protein